MVINTTEGAALSKSSIVANSAGVRLSCALADCRISDVGWLSGGPVSIDGRIESLDVFHAAPAINETMGSKMSKITCDDFMTSRIDNV